MEERQLLSDTEYSTFEDTEGHVQLRETITDDSGAAVFGGGARKRPMSVLSVMDTLVEPSKNTPHYVKEDTPDDLLA